MLTCDKKLKFTASYRIVFVRFFLDV